MLVRLHVETAGRRVLSFPFEVTDAESFGAACSEAWSRLVQKRLDQDASIGAVMEHLEEEVPDLLRNLTLRFESAEDA